MNETQIEYCYECLSNSNKFTPHKKGYRVCGKCKVEKKYSEFYTIGLSNYPHGIGYRCKECDAKYRKERYDPARNREKEYKIKYGMTLDDYNRMLASQNNKCAICNRKSNNHRQNKHLDVDHCHTTGKIRGLLCHGCNVGIGSLQDDVELLEKAIDYLRNFINPSSD